LKREAFNLGKATLDFYDERQSELLTDDERAYLARLRDIKRSDAQDEDEQFYKRHRNELKELPSLKARWDRFILGTPVETDDFLLGLALCLKSLFDQDSSSTKRRLRISCDRRTKKDLKDLNYDAGLFFAKRYLGLKELFGNRVSWEFGDLMNFEALSEQWKKATKPYVNNSTARAALQLKFVAELDVELSTGSTQRYAKQLVWSFDPNAVASEFPGDWSRLVENPLVRCRVGREPVSGKGRFQSLDLHNLADFICPNNSPIAFLCVRLPSGGNRRKHLLFGYAETGTCDRHPTQRERHGRTRLRRVRAGRALDHSHPDSLRTKASLIHLSSFRYQTAARLSG
jgi:S-DNA-T family DNA segregation ATPase FtsK/SpoIIIE